MNNLNPMEAQFLLDWFVYHMPMEQRYKLMETHPILYNKLVNLEVMEVRKKNIYPVDGRIVCQNTLEIKGE